MQLTDCFLKLVAYTTYFLKTVDRRQPPFEQFQTDIWRLIDESRTMFETGGATREDYDLARFAIFAWIDEAILNSGWKEKDRWQTEQLQRIHYQTTDAGELFFDRLNSLGPHQRDVREVYYLCLAAGFTGRYCHEGDEYLLEQLKLSNLKLLSGSSVGLPALEKTTLFPEAYPASAQESAAPRSSFRIPLLTALCIGFPAVFFAVMYLIYGFILNHIGQNLLSTLP
jgi:type VI secretion system protein ImpK